MPDDDDEVYQSCLKTLQEWYFALKQVPSPTGPALPTITPDELLKTAVAVGFRPTQICNMITKPDDLNEVAKQVTARAKESAREWVADVLTRLGVDLSSLRWGHSADTMKLLMRIGEVDKIMNFDRSRIWAIARDDKAVKSETIAALRMLFHRP